MSRPDDFNGLPSKESIMSGIKYSLGRDLPEFKVTPLDILDQTQLLIMQWAVQQFGSSPGPEIQLQVLRRELEEWIAEPSSLKEACDCFGLLMDCVRRMGYTMTDLLKETRRVYVQNIERIWEPVGPPDENGITFFHHKKEAP